MNETRPKRRTEPMKMAVNIVRDDGVAGSNPATPTSLRTETRTDTPEIDPVWHLMPADQIDRVLGQDMCDIASEFLGFTNVYLALATLIPKHWTVVDLGCAYAPQAIIFRDHKAYIGVDAGDHERFSAPNTTHHTMTIADFISEHGSAFDQDRTFAICSYVPPWYGSDNLKVVRESFKNVFTYYPASDPTDNFFASICSKARVGAST